MISLTPPCLSREEAGFRATITIFRAPGSLARIIRVFSSRGAGVVFEFSHGALSVCSILTTPDLSFSPPDPAISFSPATRPVGDLVKGGERRMRRRIQRERNTSATEMIDSSRPSLLSKAKRSGNNFPDDHILRRISVDQAIVSSDCR